MFLLGLKGSLGLKGIRYVPSFVWKRLANALLDHFLKDVSSDAVTGQEWPAHKICSESKEEEKKMKGKCFKSALLGLNSYTFEHILGNLRKEVIKEFVWGNDNFLICALQPEE